MSKPVVQDVRVNTIGNQALTAAAPIVNKLLDFSHPLLSPSGEFSNDFR
jgi:hypothetical protein